MQNLGNQRIKAGSAGVTLAAVVALKQPHTPANAVTFCSRCIAEENEKEGEKER